MEVCSLDCNSTDNDNYNSNVSNNNMIIFNGDDDDNDSYKLVVNIGFVGRVLVSVYRILCL